MAKRSLATRSEAARAHLLLQADAGGMDAAIAAALQVGIATVERVRALACRMRIV
jgi:hypothetical protein